LAEQQGAVLASHCYVEWADDSTFDSHGPRLGVIRGGQHGTLNSLTIRNIWSRCTLIVMTPELLLNSLVHAYVRLENLALLVLDEAHLLHGDATYAVIMRRFYWSNAARPKVIALTASPVAGRRPGAKRWVMATEEQMRNDLRDMEAKLDCNLWTDNCVTNGMQRITRRCIYDRAGEDEMGLMNLVKNLAPEAHQRATNCRRTLQRATLCWQECCARLSEVINELGLWAGFHAATLLAENGTSVLLDEEKQEEEDSTLGSDVARSSRSSTDEAITEAQGRLDKSCSLLREELRQWMEKVGTLNREKFVSSKARLVNDLLRSKLVHPCGLFKAIIFTRTRCICQLLAIYLQGNPELGHLVGYAVGGNSRDVGMRVRQSTVDQRSIINRFRAVVPTEKPLSILVATSVLCEGIDVPACNLVLHFNQAATPVENIQRCGRARVDGSEIVHVLAAGEDETKLHEFETYELRMQSVLATWKKQPSPIGEDHSPVRPDEEVLEDPSTGASLPIERAKGFLHSVYNWQSDRDSDSFDFCKPGFRDSMSKGGYSMFEIEPCKQGFVCSIELPTVGCCILPAAEQSSRATNRGIEQKHNPTCSSQIGVVQGLPCSRKDDAVKSAALKGCRVLREIGVLDANLQVAGRDQYRAVLAAASSGGVHAVGCWQRRPDDCAALKQTEELVRELPDCMQCPEMLSGVPCQFFVHSLSIAGDRAWSSGRGLGILLPRHVPKRQVAFLLQPYQEQSPSVVQVKAHGEPLCLPEIDVSDLVRWSQLVLELARVAHQCPLHPVLLSHRLFDFMDRTGVYQSLTHRMRSVAVQDETVQPALWLLAPLRTDMGNETVSEPQLDWTLLRRSLSVLTEFQHEDCCPPLCLGRACLGDLRLEESIVLCKTGSGSTRRSRVFVALMRLPAENSDGVDNVQKFPWLDEEFEGQQVSRGMDNPVAPATNNIIDNAVPLQRLNTAHSCVFPLSGEQFCVA